MRHDRGDGVQTGSAFYRVMPSIPADAPGGTRTVVLCVDIERCPMRLQDYFTPEQADRLADVLRAIAVDARTLTATDAERSASDRTRTVQS